MPFIDTADGTTLFARDWGDGPALVFLAGWGLPSDFWQHQLAPLSDDGFRCVAYDRRGHGRSDDPGRGFDLDTLADDLDTVLDALDLDDVTLVAHSMGASEAVRHLARCGTDRVRNVVFVGGALALPRFPAEYGETFRAGLAADFAAWVRANAAPFFGDDVSPEQQEWGIRLMLGTSLRAILDCNRAMLDTDQRDELAAVTVPALLVHGDRDASIPLEVSSAVAVDLLPDAELVVYEGAPHGLPLSHRDRLNADIAAFAKR
jgi:pimeloyl-ACP methyl ester carboxylesterase